MCVYNKAGMKHMLVFVVQCIGTFALLHHPPPPRARLPPPSPMPGMTFYPSIGPPPLLHPPSPDLLNLRRHRIMRHQMRKKHMLGKYHMTRRYGDRYGDRYDSDDSYGPYRSLSRSRLYASSGRSPYRRLSYGKRHRPTYDISYRSSYYPTKYRPMPSYRTLGRRGPSAPRRLQVGASSSSIRPVQVGRSYYYRSSRLPPYPTSVRVSARDVPTVELPYFSGSRAGKRGPRKSTSSVRAMADIRTGINVPGRHTATISTLPSRTRGITARTGVMPARASGGLRRARGRSSYQPGNRSPYLPRGVLSNRAGGGLYAGLNNIALAGTQVGDLLLPPMDGPYGPYDIPTSMSMANSLPNFDILGPGRTGVLSNLDPRLNYANLDNIYPGSRYPLGEFVHLPSRRPPLVDPRILSVRDELPRRANRPRLDMMQGPIAPLVLPLRDTSIAFGNGFASANDGFYDVLDGFGNFHDGFGKVRDGISNARENVRDGISNARENVRDSFGNVRDGVSNAYENVRDGVSKVRENVRDGFGNVRERVANVHENVRDGVSNVRENVRDGFGKVRERVANVHENVRDGVSKVRENVRDGFGKVHERVANVHENVRDGVSKVHENVRDGVSKVRDNFRNGFSFVRDGVSKAHENFKDGFSNIRDGFAKSRETMVDNAIAVELSRPSVDYLDLTHRGKGLTDLGMNLRLPKGMSTKMHKPAIKMAGDSKVKSKHVPSGLITSANSKTLDSAKRSRDSAIDYALSQGMSPQQIASGLSTGLISTDNFKSPETAFNLQDSGITGSGHIQGAKSLDSGGPTSMFGNVDIFNTGTRPEFMALNSGARRGVLSMNTGTLLNVVPAPSAVTPDAISKHKAKVHNTIVIDTTKPLNLPLPLNTGMVIETGVPPVHAVAPVANIQVHDAGVIYPDVLTDPFNNAGTSMDILPQHSAMMSNIVNDPVGILSDTVPGAVYTSNIVDTVNIPSTSIANHGTIVPDNLYMDTNRVPDLASLSNAAAAMNSNTVVSQAVLNGNTNSVPGTAVYTGDSLAGVMVPDLPTPLSPRRVIGNSNIITIDAIANANYQPIDAIQPVDVLHNTASVPALDTLTMTKGTGSSSLPMAPDPAGGLISLPEPVPNDVYVGEALSAVGATPLDVLTPTNEVMGITPDTGVAIIDAATKPNYVNVDSAHPIVMPYKEAMHFDAISMAKGVGSSVLPFDPIKRPDLSTKQVAKDMHMQGSPFTELNPIGTPPDFMPMIPGMPPGFLAVAGGIQPETMSLPPGVQSEGMSFNKRKVNGATMFSAGKHSDVVGGVNTKMTKHNVDTTLINSVMNSAKEVKKPAIGVANKDLVGILTEPKHTAMVNTMLENNVAGPTMVKTSMFGSPIRDVPPVQDNVGALGQLGLLSPPVPDIPLMVGQSVVDTPAMAIQQDLRHAAMISATDTHTGAIIDAHIVDKPAMVGHVMDTANMIIPPVVGNHAMVDPVFDTAAMSGPADIHTSVIANSPVVDTTSVVSQYEKFMNTIAGPPIFDTVVKVEPPAMHSVAMAGSLTSLDIPAMVGGPMMEPSAVVAPADVYNPANVVNNVPMVGKTVLENTALVGPQIVDSGTIISPNIVDNVHMVGPSVIDNVPMVGSPLVGSPLIDNVPMIGHPLVDNAPMVGAPLLDNVPMVGSPLVGSPLVDTAPMVGHPLVDNVPMIGSPLVGPPLVDNVPIVGSPLVDNAPMIGPPLIDNVLITGPSVVDNVPMVGPSIVNNVIVDPSAIYKAKTVSTIVDAAPMVGPSIVDSVPMVGPSIVDSAPLVGRSIVDNALMVAPAIDSAPMVGPPVIGNAPLQIISDNAAIVGPTDNYKAPMVGPAIVDPVALVGRVDVAISKPTLMVGKFPVDNPAVIGSTVVSEKTVVAVEPPNLDLKHALMAGPRELNIKPLPLVEQPRMGRAGTTVQVMDLKPVSLVGPTIIENVGSKIKVSPYNDRKVKTVIGIDSMGRETVVSHISKPIETIHGPMVNAKINDIGVNNNGKLSIAPYTETRSKVNGASIGPVSNIGAAVPGQTDKTLVHSLLEAAHTAYLGKQVDSVSWNAAKGPMHSSSDIVAGPAVVAAGQPMVDSAAMGSQTIVLRDTIGHPPVIDTVANTVDIYHETTTKSKAFPDSVRLSNGLGLNSVIELFEKKAKLEQTKSNKIQNIYPPPSIQAISSGSNIVVK